ncbi:MAG: ribosomal protein S18-alanine N-acetyltransferase, partial [Eggerthellaceae bacterium]|nr:ribosomal protein S18-alanine N-acetyltransferase [Eggerthellaceae bacterium]
WRILIMAIAHRGKAFAMSWNRERINGVAIASAPEDYAAFEAIGLSEIPDARVLDMGCFDGFNTVLKFALYSNIREIVGVDPSEQALAYAASSTNDERFCWICANCESFDGAENSFDVVYFSHVFQHLQDKEAGLANVMRLLKPGGYVIIKTVDDSNKMSYPDPDNVMTRLFALYEQHTLPNTEHTRYTDRNNGSKCYTVLKHAGFTNIAIRTTLADTAGKSLEERRALYERCTYFRKRIPENCDPDVAHEIKSLLAASEQLFERDDYYYASTTFIVIAQKPNADGKMCCYQGPLFGSAIRPFGLAEAPARAENAVDGDETQTSPVWDIVPLVEADLGQIMAIELKSFPDPWTPIAYAMELRYNPQGTYVAAKDESGTIGGYVGWWLAEDIATIANIAVDPGIRRNGIGRLLLDYACKEAKENGCSVMQLQVRAQNDIARRFYAAMGFDELSMSHGYYTNPDDDAVILARPL